VSKFGLYLKSMLKIGVIGAGHLGKIHIKCIKNTNCYELVGFYDAEPTNAKEVSETLGIKAFSTIAELMSVVDVVDIVTPTIHHFELASQAVSMGKHVFVEKPLTHTVEEAEQLLVLVEKYGVKVQVGHVERFNPAFLALGDTPIKPMFIEAHRLATFNPRGTDVSVILDLMIHDLDLILKMVDSDIKSIHASGVSVVSDTPDISNARIEFENGCVANLTASRLSLKQMRKIRIFQQDAYISMDFLEKTSQIIRLYDDPKNAAPHNQENLMQLDTNMGTKWIEVQMPEQIPVNAIQLELESFATSINENTTPIVSIVDGYKALKVAHRILDTMKNIF
jgi:predicted dehydrogenase